MSAESRAILMHLECKERAFKVDYEVCLVWIRAGYTHLEKYQMTNPNVSWISMSEWLNANVEKKNYSWSGNVLAFSNDEDAVMFKLKWG